MWRDLFFKSNINPYPLEKIKLFTQNSDLKRSGVYAWTLPAHKATLSDGKPFYTCPSAGICGGCSKAKAQKSAHLARLELVLNNRSKWLELISAELQLKKYEGSYIRIHDSGDFFTFSYAWDWLQIAKQFPLVTFYAYTKEVYLFKYMLAAEIPSNFMVVYSMGGKQDHLVNKEEDRHSDVFTDYEAMIQAGYNDITGDDKQAALHPNKKVGLYKQPLK